MTSQISLTRRQALLAGAAAVPVAAAGAGTASAAAHETCGSDYVAQPFKVGDMEVVTLLSGSAMRENPNSIFGTNVEPEQFEQVSQQNFLPSGAAQFYFTPTLVKTGGEAILFDTGLNPAGITQALFQAGHSPDDITKVVLTHMHGDHIGGLANDAGTATFANAEYVTGRAEFDHWSGTDNGNFNAKVRPLAEKFTFLEDGGSVASGVTAVAAFGHTPGHMTYMLESNGQQLLLAADMANHYVYSLGYPDWEVTFDNDKAAAAATRRRILGMLSADKVPMVGYHMPFPGLGFVEEGREAAFRWVPHSYQLA